MSKFIVSARKYRPARFQDVLGQEHISQTLKMAFSQDKLAHAFLFTGPRGVGKTTCARILAKALNCTNRTDDYEPCGKCEFCVSFDENASLSIFELDAASNNSVDHIRSLIDQVRVPPLSGKYKVFIIDEVHMLTTSAFNAFLKTLEEPPPYAVFILATTEKHKILPTILSRCQIFDFRRIQVFDIMKQLEMVASQEHVKAEEQALHLIATKADGAMRDALSIFDRIAGATNNNITYQAVTDNLNLLDFTYYFKIVDQLLTEDLSAVMLTIDDILKRGFDPEVFLAGLMEHFRQLLVSKDPETTKLIENTETVRERYASQSKLLTLDYILSALHLCNECDQNFRTTKNKRLLLEMTIIKLVYLPSLIDQSKDSSAKKKIPEPVLESAPTASRKIDASDMLRVQQMSSLNQVYDPAPKEKIQAKEADLTKSAGGKLFEPEHAQSAQKIEAPVMKKTEGEKINKLNRFVRDARILREENSKMHQTFTVETVRRLVAEYAAKASPTMKIILSDRTVDCGQSDQIHFTVASNYEKESLLLETPLLEYLRHNLKNANIILSFTIDSTLMDSAEDYKRLTKEEKLKILMEKNSLVGTIINRLNLKIDK